MATLARFTTSLPRLSGTPLRSRCSSLNSGACRLDLTTKNGRSSRPDCASSGACSSGFGHPPNSAQKIIAKHVYCSASYSGRSTELSLGSSSTTTSVALLSQQEALSETTAAHVPHGTISGLATTPLCERPGTSVASLIDLCRWRNEAQDLATSVGSEFVDVDGGPEVSDLLRELEWLLDDAVAACTSGAENLSALSSTWKACAWRDVKDLRISNGQSHSSVISNGAKDDLTAFPVDVSAIYGAFGALCKERHTDPVNEFAADCGCSCDGIRENLAGMASSNELSPESEARMSSVSMLDSALNRLKENSHGRPSLNLLRTTGLQLLLRMSVEELDKAWKERVQKRRPFQYVVAAAYWRDFVLGVVEGVLIPRPETEQIIDLVESAISSDKSLGHGLWADLGTGSGAIAIALARLLHPSGSVVAIDASSAAVLVARRNVERYSLKDKVKVLQGFWFSPLQDKAGELAGVISNPPYIPSGNLMGLQAEVGKHEPRIALDGGPDGMNDLREICTGSATALRSGGFLALETNGGEQAEALCDLLSKMRVLESTGSPVCCFQDMRSVKDFAGITRFVTATRC